MTHDTAAPDDRPRPPAPPRRGPGDRPSRTPARCRSKRSPIAEAAWRVLAEDRDRARGPPALPGLDDGRLRRRGRRRLALARGDRRADGRVRCSTSRSRRAPPSGSRPARRCRAAPTPSSRSRTPSRPRTTSSSTRSRSQRREHPPGRVGRAPGRSAAGRPARSSGRPRSGLLAGIGHRPRCRSAAGRASACVSTGDELVEPGEPVGPARSAIPTASAWSRRCKRSGAEVVWSGKAPDERDALASLLRERIADSATS